MWVGLPKEIKNEEHRVGLTPHSVYELVANGHQVLVEKNAGNDIGFKDEHYLRAGATILENVAEIYAKSDLIVKVKEPQPTEYSLLREGQLLFAYLHLAPNPALTEAIIKSNCIAIAYETVTGRYGDLPLLSPMSQVAGRLAVQVGAHCLQKPQGGSGILLGGVPGVAPGKIVVLGGGVVGTNSIRIAIGMEAEVTVLDRSLHRLEALDLQFGGRINTLFATQAAIAEKVASADLVIGAVLVPGESAPKLVNRKMLANIRPGSVMVDVAIDQGGCFETSIPTSHTHPTYLVDEIVHYCVTNMPGAVPRTSTLALNNATLPFILELANKKEKAFQEDIHLLQGLNVYYGNIIHEGVAKAFNKPVKSYEEVKR